MMKFASVLLTLFFCLNGAVHAAPIGKPREFRELVMSASAKCGDEMRLARAKANVALYEGRAVDPGTFDGFRACSDEQKRAVKVAFEKAMSSTKQAGMRDAMTRLHSALISGFKRYSAFDVPVSIDMRDFEAERASIQHRLDEEASSVEALE